MRNADYYRSIDAADTSSVDTAVTCTAVRAMPVHRTTPSEGGTVRSSVNGFQYECEQRFTK